MGRSVSASIKGRHSSAYYFLGQYKSLHQHGLAKRQLKIRLIVQDQKPVDLGVKYNGEKISLFEFEFKDGRVVGNSFKPEVRNSLNVYLVQLLKRAVEIGDVAYLNMNRLNADILFRELYDNSFVNEPLKVVKKIINTTGYYEPESERFIESDEVTEVTKEDIDQYEAQPKSERKADFEYYKESQLNDGIDEGLLFNENQFEENKLTLIANSNRTNRTLKAEQERLNKLSVAERYSDENKYKWNRKNIFECFGYLCYGTKIDAAGDRVPILGKDTTAQLKKLLYYRANNNISEHVDNFNAEWVHNFYKFCIHTGYEKRLHQTEVNPFIVDPEYKIRPDSKFEQYSVNTFGESIHKQMVWYITNLAKLGLIEKDFSTQLEPQAFTKQYNGNLSSYGEAVYNLTVTEFLKMLKTDLPKDEKKMIIARDAFVCSVMIGGIRHKNLKGKIEVDQMDVFNTIRFTQAKTKTLMQNVMLKRVQKIVEKYDGSLPPVGTTDEYKYNLQKLARFLNFDRVINRPIKKIKGQINQKVNVADLISPKFARSTYYIVGGAMGIPFEMLAKNAGHQSTDIAMKHYYNVAKNYTEKDVKELLEQFK